MERPKDEQAEDAAATQAETSETTATKRQREPTLLDFVPATVPVYTPPRGFPADFNLTPSGFRPFFIAYDGPKPFCKLAHFGMAGDNHSNINKLQSVYSANTDDRLFVRSCDVFLPPAVVVRLVDQSDVEKLRTALNELMPHGPHNRGWADPLSGDWRLADMTQEMLPGLLTALPRTAPAGAPFPHYATDVFVHHLHDYFHYDAAAEPAVREAIASSRVVSRSRQEMLDRLDSLWEPSEQQQQQPTAAEDSHTSSAQPRRKKTLLDMLTVTYPSVASASTSTSLPAQSELAIFAMYAGGSPQLTYVQLDGNSEAITRLRAIADSCEDESCWLKVWPEDEALTHEVVQQLMAEKDVEELRRMLTDLLPGGPEGDGWADRNVWEVVEPDQRALPGQIGLLPAEAPPGYAKKYGDYAAHVFTLHLQEFIRRRQR